LRAILFGSFARRDFSKRSDIDVVMIEQTQTPFLDRIGKYLKILRNHPCMKAYDIDVLVYTPEEFIQMQQDGNRFIAGILKEGKILYEHTALDPLPRGE
jgi:predicted nucleotidyltransferase